MYQPLIKFHPYPAIITQVLCIFAIMYPLMYEVWHFAVTESIWIKNQKNGTIS